MDRPARVQVALYVLAIPRGRLYPVYPSDPACLASVLIGKHLEDDLLTCEQLGRKAAELIIQLKDPLARLGFLRRS
jgi:hypothetical protein